MVLGEAAYLGLGRIAVPVGPVLPRSGVLLGQRAERRVNLERGSLSLDVRLERPVGPEPAPQMLERLHLRSEHRVAVNPRCGVQTLGLRAQLGEQGTYRLGAGHPLDAQVDRVTVEPAARVVGARLLRERRHRRMQRVDHQHAGREVLGRPACELAQIGQIADAPALLRMDRVELRGPAPRAEPLGHEAAARAHDHTGARAVLERHELVVTERNIARQIGLDAPDRAIFEPELGRRLYRPGLAHAEHEGVRVARHAARAARAFGHGRNFGGLAVREAFGNPGSGHLGL